MPIYFRQFDRLVFNYSVYIYSIDIRLITNDKYLKINILKSKYCAINLLRIINIISLKFVAYQLY